MRILYPLFLLFFVSSVSAQKATSFVVKRSGNSLFVEHKVVPKENWYSVGRIYMISPKEIASFNGLSLEKGLGIGQTLEVPLTKSNFSQSANASDGGIPVVHIVQPKESLFKIAGLYQVDINLLKKWNAFKGDQVNSGFKLVVGYIKVATPSQAGPIDQAVSKQPTNAALSPAPVSQQVPIEAKTEKETQKAETSITPSETKQPEAVPQTKQPPQVTESTNQELKENGVGHFFQTFNMQAKEGALKQLDQPKYGLFKSSSGWQDGKYYILMNDVPPGTIVRISSGQTGKEIYAKVLAPVPAGKESEGLVIRMSNASAAALALGEATNGNLSVQWYK